MFKFLLNCLPFAIGLTLAHLGAGIWIALLFLVLGFSVTIVHIIISAIHSLMTIPPDENEIVTSSGKVLKTDSSEYFSRYMPKN